MTQVIPHRRCSALKNLLVQQNLTVSDLSSLFFFFSFLIRFIFLQKVLSRLL